MLNFANGEAGHVGGGYKKGALAQEEDLCRRMPNLYTSLLEAKDSGCYPYGPSTYRGGRNPERYADVLITCDVILAREGEAQDFAKLPPAKELPLTVVSAAAPNIAFGGEIADRELMLQAVRCIFAAPKIIQPTLKVLILGAWGCGAFGCDPVMISDLFITVMAQEGYGQQYDEVHFAIPKGSDNNADIFRKAFQKAKIVVRDMA